MTGTVYAKLKASGDLPSPTGVAMEILRLTQDRSATQESITAAVQADPAISARLLKIVNSPLAGLSRQIASVSRAIALLGVRTVANLALGFSLMQSGKRGTCRAFDYDAFWSESVGIAVAARHVTNRRGGFAADEAFTCGLVCQIGRLALAATCAQAYEKALAMTPAPDRYELAEIEQAVFEIDHNELAAQMMTDWHMPRLFCDAVRAQDHPDDCAPQAGSRAHFMAQILHLARSIALIMPASVVEREALAAVVVEARRLGIAPDVFTDLFDTISRDWHEVGEVLSVRTRRVPSLAELYTQARQRRAQLTQAVPAAGDLPENCSWEARGDA
ncbi:MAG: HDOD domain-containing protein [Planctomycetes bacterium]|nr:HDOD domain-containing protein [Planctomycetota bacterium]